jgi:hypothetical protein
MIRTTNDVMRSLFHTSLPARYWVESLHTATYLLNSSLPKQSPPPLLTLPSLAPLPPMCTFVSSGVPATPTSLPSLPTSSLHALPGVFLGYSSEHKGYRCLDLSSNRIIISRHVIFDESSFPFASPGNPPPDYLDILFEPSPTVSPIATLPSSPVAGTSPPAVAPRAVLTLQPAPHATPAAAPRSRRSSPRHMPPQLRPRLHASLSPRRSTSDVSWPPLRHQHPCPCHARLHAPSSLHRSPTSDR